MAAVAEECSNGKANQTTVTAKAEQLPSNPDDILFSVDSKPPWYIVIAYALQVRFPFCCSKNLGVFKANLELSEKSVTPQVFAVEIKLILIGLNKY